MKVGRRTWLMLLSLAALACAIVLVWPRETEPVYEGRRLSEWLRLGATKDPVARDAILTIGTNALPYLLRGIAYEPSPLRKKMIAAERSLPTTLRSFSLQRIVEGSGADRVMEAYIGFAVLGAEAAPAVAELSRLANGTNSIVAKNAMYALAMIGKPGIPTLVAIVTNTNHAYRASAAYYIGCLRHLDPDAKMAVPTLLQCVGDSNRLVVVMALESLGTLASEPAACIPVLTNQLQSADAGLRVTAVRSIGMFHREAQPAVPALEALLSDPNVDVRREATNALDSIGPERFTKQVFE